MGVPESALRAPVAPRQLLHLSKKDEGRFKRVLRPSVPVAGLPRIVMETSVTEQLCFSLRGNDGILFRAYLNSFVATWGDYVTLRDAEPQELHPNLENPSQTEWYVIGDTSPAIWRCWEEMMGQTPTTVTDSSSHLGKEPV